MVFWMGCLDCVDVDDSKSMLRAEGESGGLDATITVGSMGGAMEGHDSGGTEKGDCLFCKHCGIVTFAKKRCESSVCWVSRVNEVLVGFLEGEDVKFLGGSKVSGTGGGVVMSLVPCCSTEGGGMSGRRGGKITSGSGGGRLLLSEGGGHSVERQDCTMLVFYSQQEGEIDCVCREMKGQEREKKRRKRKVRGCLVRAVYR